MVSVQPCCRHRVIPSNPTCCLDIVLQFHMILNINISEKWTGRFVKQSFWDLIRAHALNLKYLSSLSTFTFTFKIFVGWDPFNKFILNLWTNVLILWKCMTISFCVSCAKLLNVGKCNLLVDSWVSSSARHMLIIWVGRSCPSPTQHQYLSTRGWESVTNCLSPKGHTLML